MSTLMKKINKDEEAKELKWGPGEDWWVGNINLLNSVNDELTLPNEITVMDATLREGEETPGVILSEDQKVELAFAIEEAGFKEFEIGYAGVIPEHYSLVKRLQREGFSGRIASHTRIYGRSGEWQREIDQNLEAGADLLTMVGFASEVGVAVTPWLTKEEMPERVAKCVSYATSQGARTSFGLANLVRTSLENIVACYRAAAEAGVDRAYVYDGMGAARPETIRFLTRFIRDLIGPEAEIGVHVHNTFGLSTANALTALTSGATEVDGVLLGLGEGAGITASEEICGAMEVLYGIKTGIELDKLRPLCLKVAEEFGINMPLTKAVVGENTYTHLIDSHVAGVLRGAWYFWEVAKPEVLGHARKLYFGQGRIRDGRSGAVAALLEKMGLEVTDEELNSVIAELRMETENRPFLSPGEAEEIVHRVLKQ